MRLSSSRCLAAKETGCAPGKPLLVRPSISATSLRSICASLWSALMPGMSGTEDSSGAVVVVVVVGGGAVDSGAGEGEGESVAAGGVLLVSVGEDMVGERGGGGGYGWWRG